MKPVVLNDFIGRLAELGFVAQSKPIRSDKIGRLTRIEVGNTGKPRAYTPQYENSMKHYLDMFDEGRYSLLLYDGAMISISYTISKKIGL